MAQKSDTWQRSAGRGLTPAQAQMLTLLASRPEGGMRFATLGAHLGVTASAAADAVAELVGKGLAHLTPAPGDSGDGVVLLTDEGRQRARAVGGWPDALLPAVEALSEQERAVLLRALSTLIRELQERHQIPVARMCATCRFFGPDRYPGSPRPHHCAFVDAPFGDAELRMHCPDQQPAQRAGRR